MSTGRHGGWNEENPKSETRSPKQIENIQKENSKREIKPVSNLGDSDFEFVSDFGFRYSDFSLWFLPAHSPSRSVSRRSVTNMWPGLWVISSGGRTSMATA